MVLASAQPHPSFPLGRGRADRNRARGRLDKLPYWSEWVSSLCDTGWQQSLGSGRAQGGHRWGKAPEKEKQIFWLHNGGS